MKKVESSTTEFRSRTDPVTFEVLRHRLWQINDEQGRTIINVSGSPVASEVNDFNVALADAAGQLISLGPYLIHHCGAISVVIKNVLEMLGEEIAEGDIYLTNDPWMGALHQNDVCCVAPVHHAGRIVAWTACTVHQIDVGGPVPGSWNLRAADTFQEAPRYRFLRVMREGRIQPEVVETYLTNSRTPHLLELDLRAMVASSNVVKERLAETIARYGVDVVVDAMQDCVDYSEARLRSRLALVPDGTWYSEDYLDHDGHREATYAIRLKLTKRGSQLTFDYTATDDQAPGFINCTYAGCLAGTLSPVITYICSDIPWNEGILRCLDVVVRDGCLNNASFPAPVGMATISACHHTSNASAAAVAKMLSASDDLHERLMANWTGSAFVYNVFGRNQYGQSFGTMLVDSHLGGAGARYIGDGYSTSGTLTVPRPSVPNVESVESLYPLLYLYRRRAADSGGPGRHRGGVSGSSAMLLYGADELNVTVSTIGADHSCAVGTAGGYPGGAANSFLVRGSRALDLLSTGSLDEDPTSWGGEYRILPSKEAFVLHTGDVLITVPHGGGGLGDPITRDPEAVRTDVTNGYVSPRAARSVYAVALTESDEVDHEVTARLRCDERVKRLGGSPEREPTGSHRAGVTRITDTIAWDSTRFLCTYCGGTLEPEDGNPRSACAIREAEVGKPSPWVAPRWKGVSPNFHLREYICPHCGLLLDVHLRRRDEAGAWDDCRVSM